MTKPQQTNEHMREVINHSTHTNLLNTIKSILTQTLEKLYKKRVHGRENFDNLYFWNTLNKTHQGILVWDRNNRLHTIYKKHVYKERKETIYVMIGEEDIHHHIYISKISTINAITKWSQDQCTRDNVSKIERKEKIQKDRKSVV